MKPDINSCNMNLSFRLYSKLNLLNNSISFFKTHFLVIMALGLTAAFGRVIQLGGFGHITGGTNVVLEIVIELSRILLFLYVLGLASIKNGIQRIRNLFTNRNNQKATLIFAIQKFEKEWFSILLNVTGFLVIAWGLNYLIDLLAYQTCLYLTLKKDGILTESSSEWTVLLFFKNLTVIPFTLIFETVLILSLSNKLTSLRKIQLS